MMIIDARCFGCSSYLIDCDGTVPTTDELTCYGIPKTCHHGTNLELGDCIQCEGGE